MKYIKSLLSTTVHFRLLCHATHLMGGEIVAQQKVVTSIKY